MSSDKDKHIQKAEKHYGKGEYKDSIYWYTRALSEDLRDAEMYAQRGVAHYHSGDLRAALSDLSKARDLEPLNPYRYSSRAYIRDAMGDTAGAITDYEEAVRLDPEDAVAHNNLGLLEEKMGRNQQANALFAKADQMALGKGFVPSEEPKPRNIQSDINRANRSENFSSVLRNVFTTKAGFSDFIHFVRKGLK